MIETLITRTVELWQTFSMLRSLADIRKKGCNLDLKTIERRITREHDYSRRPVSPSVRLGRGVGHLWVGTVLWRTVEEFDCCRKEWDAFRAGGRVLKATGDLADYEEYQAMPRIEGILRFEQDLGGNLPQRMLLRAARGLYAKVMIHSDVARWLIADGWPTSKVDDENTKRPNGRLVEPLVPKTADLDGFLTHVEARFPSFEAQRLAAPEPTNHMAVANRIGACLATARKSTGTTRDQSGSRLDDGHPDQWGRKPKPRDFCGRKCLHRGFG